MTLTWKWKFNDNSTDLLSDHEITCPSLPSQRGSLTCIEVLGFRQLAHQALEGDQLPFPRILEVQAAFHRWKEALVKRLKISQVNTII